MSKLQKKENKKEDHNEDVEIIPEDNEKYSGDCVKKVKKLKEEIKKLKEEKQEYLTGWQLARAELVNTKKRLDEEHKSRQAWAGASVLESFLPVADSFVMAMSNKEVWESVDDNWRKGVEYIYSQMEKILSDNGLSKIDAIGKVFDSRLHEAVDEKIVSEEGKSNLVDSVRNNGYMLGDKVLRPAKVVVCRYEG